MYKQNSKEKWIEAGYELFAREGLKEVRIERLARDLDLNKSSFYHFFGDIDHFFENIIEHHKDCAERYIMEIGNCRKFDPDYLQVMVKYRQNFRMHWQLLKNRNKPGFFLTYESINKKVDNKVEPLWVAFMDMQNMPALAMKYFQFVRGRFYASIDIEKMDYESLHSVSIEARDLIRAMKEVPDHNLSGILKHY
jgi:AcrR family transcriptional regulator